MRRHALLTTTALLLTVTGCAGEARPAATPAAAAPSTPAPSTSAPSTSAPTTGSPTAEPTRDPESGLGPEADPGRPVRVDLDGEVPAGAAPATAYVVDGRTLVRPDGTRTTLPEDYLQVLVLGERLVALRGTGPRRRVDVLGAGGGVLSSHPARGRVAQSVDRTVVAWSGFDGRPMTLATDQPEPLGMSGYATPTAVRAVLGSRTCAEVEGASCSVLVGAQGDRPATITASHGNSDVVAPKVREAADLTSRLAAVSSGNGCLGVTRHSPWRWLWHECDPAALPTRFSPDGDTLLLVEPGDETGGGGVQVRRARTGEPVLVARAGAGDRVLQSCWEDATHLLVVVLDGPDARVLRVGADGTTSTAVSGSSGPLLLACDS